MYFHSTRDTIYFDLVSLFSLGRFAGRTFLNPSLTHAEFQFIQVLSTTFKWNVAGYHELFRGILTGLDPDRIRLEIIAFQIEYTGDGK